MQSTMVSSSPVRELSLAHRVSERLAETGRLRLKHVQVEDHAGAIVLSGSVPSFYLKQLAQTIARSVGGETRVRNNMIVAPARS